MQIHTRHRIHIETYLNKEMNNMAMTQVELWERDHPEYKRLNQDDPNREVLEWDHKEKYIVLNIQGVISMKKVMK